ncbi:Peroxisome assembly protein 12 [Lachancea thermotolerans]
MDFYSNLPAASSSIASSIFPTLFEVLSADEIDELLTPSVRYIVANLVARNPNKLTIRFSNWFDEWFVLAAKLTLESYYLKTWDATFIEVFYGLKRINASDAVLLRTLQSNPPVEIPMRLTRFQRRAVLCEKVLAPYVALKLDLLHSKLLARSLLQHPPAQEMGQRVRESLRALYLRFYPLLKKLLFVLNLAVKLYFLSGRTGSTSLLDLILNIQYTRLSKYDYSRNDRSSTAPGQAVPSRPQRLNRSALLFLCRASFSKIKNLLKLSVSQMLPAFIFLLRVFQWWSSQDLSGEIQRRLNNIDKDIPPPPGRFEKNTEGTCRICNGPIRNPAVIGTGYVFCYPCILDYLPQHEGKCPVTGSQLLGCQYDKDSGHWSIKGVRKLLL